MPVHRRTSWLGGLVALLVAGLLMATGAQTSASAVTPPSRPAAAYAAATGHILADPFFAYWSGHEGMTALGLPVTEPVAWQGGRAQFFQYGALQLSAAKPGTKATVGPISVGQDLLSGVRGAASGAVVAGRHVGDAHLGASVLLQGTSDQVFGGAFAVGPAFQAYYALQGGAQRFGTAISGPTDLNGTTVQWFQFARLQLAADGSGAVAPAPVGQEMAAALEVSTAKVAQGRYPLLDTQRYRIYQGDGTIPQAVAPFDPTHITIPAINVDANIEQVPILNGVMGVPQDAWNVGWYPDISQPGHDTNVVMAGHKDWWGIGPTVFANLQNLSAGDKVYLTDADGAGFTYQITSVDSVDANVDAGQVVNDTGSEMLTLITCTGSFDGQEYADRLIVRAQRI